MKINFSLVTTWKMIRLVNARKMFVIVIVKGKDDYKSNYFKGCDHKYKDKLVKIVSKYDEVF